MTIFAILLAIEGRRAPMARRKLADTVQLKLRFPEKLRRRIEAAAAKNQQSMNLEIVERLEQSFQRDDETERSRNLVQETAQATAAYVAEAMAQVTANAQIILGAFLRPRPETWTEAEWAAERQRAIEHAADVERVVEEVRQALKRKEHKP
jgi:hypothetical protein